MSMRLFVSNIPFGASEDDLRKAFETEGCEIADVRIVNGTDGRSRGFGFVRVERYAKPEAVLEKMLNVRLQGRKLLIDRAKGDPQRRSPSS